MTRFIANTLFAAIGILSTTTANAAVQEVVSTKVLSIRAHNSVHLSTPARGTISVTFSTTLPGSNCQKLWSYTANSASPNADSATLTLLTSAMLAGKSVYIQYIDTDKAPWGDDTTCKLIAVQINN